MSANHRSRMQLMQIQQQMQTVGGNETSPPGSYMSPHASALNVNGAAPMVPGGVVDGTIRSQARAPSAMSYGNTGTIRSQASGYRQLHGAGSMIASMNRSGSRGALHKTSRSLGASKASLASMKSGKTTIAQEHHDIKVQHTFHAIYKGKARTPFSLAIVCFLLGLLSFSGGCALVIKRAFAQIFLTHDQQELIGPLLIAFTVVFFGVGMHFIHSAYKINAMERNQIRFVASNAYMVAAKKKERTRGFEFEKLASGTAGKNAVQRSPVGSLMGSRSSFDL